MTFFALCVGRLVARYLNTPGLELLDSLHAEFSTYLFQSFIRIGLKMIMFQCGSVGSIWSCIGSFCCSWTGL